MKIHPLYALAIFTLLAAGCDNSSDSNSQLNSETQELHRSAHEFVETVKTLPKFIRETPGAIKAIYAALRELHTYVADNDYEKARAAAATIDRVLKSRTLSWYVQILAKEEAQGIPAALSLIEELRQSDDISATEKESLNHFVTVFDKKGEIKSLDVLLLVSAAALESKAGKGAGAALLALQYPVRPDDTSSTTLKSILEAEFSGVTSPANAEKKQDPNDQLPAESKAKAK